MEKKEQIAQMSRMELEQEFRKKFTAEANMEDSKREWSDRVMKNFYTKTLVYLLSLESREEQEEFIDLATNRQFQKNPIERDRLHEHVSRGDGISARADSNGESSQASRMENGARSEEKGNNPSNERGVSQTPQSPSHQQNSPRDLGLSLSREQPGQTGRLRLFDHGQMGSLFPTDHENQRESNDNELDRSSDRANENGDKSPRQNGSANQKSARSERYGIAQGSSNQSVLPLAQSRLHHAGLSAPNGLGNLEENRDQKRGLLSNLDHLESLLNAIRNKHHSE